jgi:beta-glucosidase
MSATDALPTSAADAPRFPADVRFGAATAAFQVEGAAREDGRGESIWDRFCRIPGAVVNGDTGDVACDHYHRLEQDLDLMAGLGLETYRFSIAWPRIQPTGRGPVEPRGVGFYRRLADGLRERGIEPVATLYHWDLPQTLQDEGGWPARDTAERFAEYAALAGDALGDLVTAWVTHNEPWVVAFLGHAHGLKAPGVRDWSDAVAASHHLLLSHGLAVEALRAACRAQAEIGIALNLAPVHAAGPGGDHEAAARRMDGHLNRWFLDPLLRGRYPSDMVDDYERALGALPALRAEDLGVIGRPIDFLGVNYYSPQRVFDAPADGPLRLRHAPPPPPTTAMGWEVDPGGLHEVLLRVRRDYGDVPISITENGSAFEDPPAGDGVVEDPDRTAFLQRHLEALSRAVADGVDVRRYHVWSLLDNFEWEHGYARRFGIVHVDYATQRRTLKRSGLWYRDFIAVTRARR